MISFPLGTYPTPVERLGRLERPTTTLWVKRDDRTHPDYGGNKVRKLEYVLKEALARKVDRIVTVGAVGSHHVLATTLFGTRAGLAVEAVLVPQPGTPHALSNLRADLALGLTPFTASSTTTAPFALARRLVFGGGHPYYVPVGGSSALGAQGYVDAALELAQQIRAGELPKPDLVVVTVGSGGTAAGLVVGFAKAGLDIPVLGVCVATPVFAVRLMVSWLIGRTAALASADARRARSLLTLTTAFLGGGYGFPTEEGRAATERASVDAGLVLDPTYTSKTFAATLAEVATDRHQHVLYWHTLSSAPLTPLLERAPAADDVPPKLARLLR